MFIQNVKHYTNKLLRTSHLCAKTNRVPFLLFVSVEKGGKEVALCGGFDSPRQGGTPFGSDCSRPWEHTDYTHSQIMSKANWQWADK